MREIRFASYFHAIMAFVIYFQIAFPKLIPIAILLILALVITGYSKKKLAFKWKLPLILLICFYLAYLIGVFFTNNPDQAKLYLENKLSFLIFPLLFMFETKFKFELKWIVFGAILGVLQVGILGLFHSLGCNTADYGSLGCFTSSNFSYIHHPSYFAVYILITTFSSWYGFFMNWKFFKLIWIIPLTFVFLVFYLQCLSLAGMLFLVLLLFFLFAKYIQHKFGKIAFLSSLILTPVLIFVLFSNIPKFKVEFNDSISSATKFMASPKKFMKEFTQYHTGSEERMIMWTVTLAQIKEHPFGVGTGDVDFYLQKELKANYQENLATKNYNPHNQFLQTTLEIGIVGLLVLLSFIFTSFKIALKSRNLILLLLLATLVFNSLFESMLQLQSGIVYYSLWIPMLMLFSSTKYEEKNVNLHL